MPIDIIKDSLKVRNADNEFVNGLAIPVGSGDAYTAGDFISIVDNIISATNFKPLVINTPDFTDIEDGVYQVTEVNSQIKFNQNEFIDVNIGDIVLLSTPTLATNILILSKADIYHINYKYPGSHPIGYKYSDIDNFVNTYPRQLISDTVIIIDEENEECINPGIYETLNTARLQGKNTSLQLVRGSIIFIYNDISIFSDAGHYYITKEMKDASSWEDSYSPTYQQVLNDFATKTEFEMVESIAKGATQAISFTDYFQMISLLGVSPKDKFNVGQNFYIETINVPDLWIESIETERVPYEYDSDETFVKELLENGHVQVGYYTLACLETAKVDLDNYVKKTDYADYGKVGLIQPAYSLGMLSNGRPVADTMSKAVYANADIRTFIGKGTLENLKTKAENGGINEETADKDVSIPTTLAVKNYVDKIKNEVEMAKTPNAIIIGNPTINNGQVSDFSTADYLQYPTMVDFENKSFEIDFSITTQQIGVRQSILGSSYGLAFLINANNQFEIYCKFKDSTTPATSWDTNKTSTFTVVNNRTYYIQIIWDKTTYKVNISEEPSQGYQTIITIDDTDGTRELAPKQMLIGVNSLLQNPFKGIINLNDAKLIKNNVLEWQGMDSVGIATRMARDVSNIDEAGIERIKNIANGIKTFTNPNGATIVDLTKVFTETGIYQFILSPETVDPNSVDGKWGDGSQKIVLDDGKLFLITAIPGDAEKGETTFAGFFITGYFFMSIQAGRFTYDTALDKYKEYPTTYIDNNSEDSNESTWSSFKLSTLQEKTRPIWLEDDTIELDNNNDLRSGEHTNLTILIDLSGYTESELQTLEFYSNLTFKSGATATNFAIEEGTPDIYWQGDDINSSGMFEPIANKIYELHFYWNGYYMNCIVTGKEVPSEVTTVNE